MARYKVADKPEHKLALELTKAETAYAAEPTLENKEKLDEAYRAWWRCLDSLLAWITEL